MSHPTPLIPAPRHSAWALIPVLAALVLLPLASPAARAGEIVPSIGITKAVDGNSDAQVFGGLALRGSLLPTLQSEIGVSYRRETRDGGQLSVRQWPVTASLWFSPISVLYAGGGVGLYQTTLEYDASLSLPDVTSRKFGVHLGGGVKLPLAPRASLDLGGRYIFLEQQRSELPPNHFNPDFWTTSVGLAVRF